VLPLPAAVAAPAPAPKNAARAAALGEELSSPRILRAHLILTVIPAPLDLLAGTSAAADFRVSGLLCSSRRLASQPASSPKPAPPLSHVTEVVVHQLPPPLLLHGQATPWPSWGSGSPFAFHFPQHITTHPALGNVPVLAPCKLLAPPPAVCFPAAPKNVAAAGMHEPPPGLLHCLAGGLHNL
jgi:hypothetical protein